MIRRTFLTIWIVAITKIASASVISLVIRRFAFKIRTKDGGVVGNVLIEAHDEDAAKVKLFKRFPGCTVLSVMEK
jgi:hypothetical protein